MFDTPVLERSEGEDLFAPLEALRARLLEQELAGIEPPPSGSELVARCGDFAELDPRCLSDDRLLGVAADLEAAQRLLDAARAHVHASLDGRGVTVTRFGDRTRAWLAGEHGLAAGEAGRRVRVASKLARHLPVIDAALTEGAITFEHARVIADLLIPRVHDVVVELQEQFIALAAGVRFERWVTEVRDLINRADADGGHDPSPERNRASLGDGLDGELFLRSTLVGEGAAVVRHTLNTMADRLFHRRRRDAQVAPEDLPLPTRSRLLAEALVELCRLGTAASPGTRTGAADVTLVVPAGEPTVARTPEGVRLADGTTRLFLCDPTIRALVVDSLGVPLDLGHAVRYATPEQRRAGAVRDGGCVFPRCDVPASQVDWHHVVYAEDDGPTDMANLGGLCRFHHGIVHRTGWSMTATDDQWFIFTTPTGAVLTSQRHGRQRHDRQRHDRQRHDTQRAGP